MAHSINGVVGQRNRLINIQCLGAFFLMLFCLHLPSIGFANSLCSETFSAKYDVDGRLLLVRLDEVIQKNGETYELPTTIVLQRSPFAEPTELLLRYYDTVLWQRIAAYAEIGELPNVNLGGRIFLNPWTGEPVFLIAAILPKSPSHKRGQIVEFPSSHLMLNSRDQDWFINRGDDLSRFDEIDYDTLNF